MTTLPIHDRTGAEVGSYEIDLDALAPKISKQLLHDAVVMYQANARMGTHRTKSRGEVSGSTKKMYRQKGTGNARAGSKRSGIRRGGGHILSIRPRDYGYRLPRKALRAATRMAIASKVQDGQLLIVDEFKMGEPKTKEMADVLSALGLGGTTAHLATDGYDVNVYKSARNISGVSVSPASELNALLVLGPNRLVVTKAALDSIVAGGDSAGGQGEGENGE